MRQGRVWAWLAAPLLIAAGYWLAPLFETEQSSPATSNPLAPAEAMALVLATPTVPETATVPVITTETPTPTPTKPAPTPTIIIPTPAPSANFAPSFLSVAPAATDSGTRWPPLRGRVLDWQRVGIPGINVRAWNETTSETVATGVDGSYSFASLPPGIYSVRIEGFQGRVAQNIYLDGNNSVVLEFVEAATQTPGTPTPIATATPTQVVSILSASPTSGPRRVTTPLATSLARPSPTPRREGATFLGLGIDLADLELDPDPWTKPFLLGAAAAYALALVGVVAATLRR